MDSKNRASLKSKAIARIRDDMICETIKQSRKGFLIIIIDDYSSKILSSFLSMSQLLNMGVFSVERLGTIRQPFPRYQALYFIEPTQYSLELIAKDFSNKDKPMYSRLNVFFTHKIDEDFLDALVEQSIIGRILQCKEVNLSFLIRGRNLFDLGFDNNLKMFSVTKPEQALYMRAVKDRLITACLAMNEYPHVQYQKNSNLCLELANMVNEGLKSSNKDKRERKGILLITDRTIDPTAPFLHDYNWEPLVRDLFLIENHNELTLDKTKKRLDDTDELWDCYKNEHLVQVFEKLSEDFDEFMKSDLSKVGKNEEINQLEEMGDALKNMASYKEKNQLFSYHLKLAEEVNKKYKEQRLGDIIGLEQDIVSGFLENSEIITPKEIFTKFNIIKNKIEKRECIIRLLGIILTCLDINEKDFNIIADNLNERESTLFKNLEYLGISFSKIKGKNIRRSMTLEKAQRKEIKQRLTKIEYKVLRSYPKLVEIVESCSANGLPDKEFGFVEKRIGITSPSKNRGNKKIFLGNDDDSDDDEDKPLLFLFNIGGLCFNEISALENLAKQGKLTHRLILGSTGLYDANLYMEELVQVSEGRMSLPRNEKSEKKVDHSEIELIISS